MSNKDDSELDVRSVLDKKVDRKYSLKKKEIVWINMWEEFLKNVNIDTKLPGHPIWADSFKGDEELPGEISSISHTKKDLLKIYHEWKNYGWVKPIKSSMKKNEIIKCINLPLWKQDFIRKNRLLYFNNKKFIDKWMMKWDILGHDDNGNRIFPVSRTKYEWQAGPTSRSNWENIFIIII